MAKKKILKRSKKNRIIAGVCGGIGEYSNVDPTIIRILWAVGTFFAIPAGIIFYIVAIVVIPE